MIFRGARIGELLVETRAPDERYRAQELRLLAALAGGAGPAAHALVLTEDLRLARERIVLAREEERRRLRRDLHDGVGAGLAGAVLQLRSARRRLPDAGRVEPLLATATDDLIDLTAEVRRVVDGLRPAGLDRGLGPALRELATPYAAGGLVVEVSVPDELTGLPAAVEVAAYQIAREALANVTRHAQARRVGLRVEHEPSGLRLVVSDDGVGPPAEAHAAGQRVGLGVGSMRERAAELGGRLEIGPADPVGTRVEAWLPAVAGDRLVP